MLQRWPSSKSHSHKLGVSVGAGVTWSGGRASQEPENWVMSKSSMAIVDSSVARMPPMRIWGRGGGGEGRKGWGFVAEAVRLSWLLLWFFDVNYIIVVCRCWLLLLQLSLLLLFVAFYHFLIIFLLCLSQFIFYFLRFFYTHPFPQFVTPTASLKSSKWPSFSRFLPGMPLARIRRPPWCGPDPLATPRWRCRPSASRSRSCGRRPSTGGSRSRLRRQSPGERQTELEVVRLTDEMDWKKVNIRIAALPLSVKWGLDKGNGWNKQIKRGRP